LFKIYGTLLNKRFTEHQAFEKAFFHCDNHVWNIGVRSVPIGLQYSGGSDWFCLHYDFINYVIESEHEYVKEWKSFLHYSLLPSEVGFIFQPFKLDSCLVKYILSLDLLDVFSHGFSEFTILLSANNKQQFQIY
jgi:hypothetical protein